MDLVPCCRIGPVHDATGAVLLYQRDPVAAAGHVDGVAVNIRVVGILDLDPGTPEPDRLVRAVVGQDVVADHHGLAALVIDPATAVVDQPIVLSVCPRTNS